MNELSLANRVALITGAGGGMGGTAARAYARAGAKVIIADMNLTAAQAVADEIIDSSGSGTALPAVCDVTVPEQVQSVVEKGFEFFKKIDILLNCAGFQGPGAPVWEVDPVAWRKTVDVNLWGFFLACRYIVPRMIQNHYGRIINVASGAGVKTMPFFSGYAASKAGCIHFTRTLAEELMPYGITANAMGVRGVTPMWKDVLEAGEGGGTTTRMIRQQVADGMDPKTEENIPVFLFLASEISGHVTGQYLEANSLPQYAVKY